MVEIVLMGFAINGIHTVQIDHFWKELMQEMSGKKEFESSGGLFAQNDFVQFIHDAFTRDNIQAFRIIEDCLKAAVFDFKFQLSGKANRPHHAQRIVGIRCVWVEWRTNNAIVQVFNSSKRVN